MKKAVIASFLLSIIVAVPVALGSSIKTWSTGEAIRASDLNTVLAHLHANLGHGHGAIVANADISATAAIAHSKLAEPALVPKAWATVTTACDGAAVAGTACTIAASSGVASVTANAVAGQYRVNLQAARSDASFGVLVTSHTAGTNCVADTFVATSVGTPLGGNFLVKCLLEAGGAAGNTAFSVLVMDNT